MAEMRTRALGRLLGVRAERPHCDHDPRYDVTKDLPGDDLGPGGLRRLVAWLHKVHRDRAVAWPQHAGSDLHNPGKVRRIANRPDGLRAVARVHPEVLASPERARQRLALLGEDLVAMALHVQSAVEVIACVRVPISILARQHDE